MLFSLYFVIFSSQAIQVKKEGHQASRATAFPLICCSRNIPILDLTSSVHGI